MRVATVHSYAPRNTAPPAEIHNVLGITPENMAFTPSFRYIPMKREPSDGILSTFGFCNKSRVANLVRQINVRLIVQRTLKSSITRVLRTSRGVVTAAAKPPAMLPHTDASYACKGLPPNERDSRTLRNSYSGNWMDVKGIYTYVSAPGVNIKSLSTTRTSRMMVEPYPL